MRADLDNIIYIIITILVLAFSALKKKKAPQEAPVENEERSLGDTLFPELKEIERMLQRQEAEAYRTEEEEEEVEEYRYEAESVEPIQELKYTSLDDYVPLVSNAFSSIQDGSLEKKTAKEEEIEGHSPLTVLSEFDPANFNLRQAVIQTEILNRKYF